MHTRPGANDLDTLFLVSLAPRGYGSNPLRTLGAPRHAWDTSWPTGLLDLLELSQTMY